MPSRPVSGVNNGTKILAIPAIRKSPKIRLEAKLNLESRTEPIHPIHIEEDVQEVKEEFLTCSMHKYWGDQSPNLPLGDLLEIELQSEIKLCQ